jgi:hypothetical protein
MTLFSVAGLTAIFEVDLSPAQSIEALSTVRLVMFRLEGQPERRGMGGAVPTTPTADCQTDWLHSRFARSRSPK